MPPGHCWAHILTRCPFVGFSKNSGEMLAGNEFSVTAKSLIFCIKGDETRTFKCVQTEHGDKHPRHSSELQSATIITGEAASVGVEAAAAAGADAADEVVAADGVVAAEVNVVGIGTDGAGGAAAYVRCGKSRCRQRSSSRLGKVGPPQCCDEQ